MTAILCARISTTARSWLTKSHARYLMAGFHAQMFQKNAGDSVD